MTDPSEHTKDELVDMHRDAVGEDPPSSATKADIAEAIDAASGEAIVDIVPSVTRTAEPGTVTFRLKRNGTTRTFPEHSVEARVRDRSPKWERV